MPYNTVADSIHAKKLCSRLSSNKVRFQTINDLGATYDDHLVLIRKHAVDFLLVLIELISLGVTAEALQTDAGKNDL